MDENKENKHYSEWTDTELQARYGELSTHVVDRLITGRQVEGTKLMTELETLFCELGYRELPHRDDDSRLIWTDPD